MPWRRYAGSNADTDFTTPKAPDANDSGATVLCRFVLTLNSEQPNIDLI
jgi:hypothetical protein